MKRADGKESRPDDKWGERVVAVVQLHPDSTADEAELVTAVKTRIGSVRRPSRC